MYLKILRQSYLKKLKLRCICCDQVGKKKSKEHFWPLWLSKRANLNKKGVRWGSTFANPKTAVISICKECNNTLGAFLEAPVSKIFDDLENSKSISDNDCELLIKWLWKIEGYQSKIINFSNPDYLYSHRWTLIERLLNKDAFKNIRTSMSVGISLIKNNLDSDGEWPVGGFYREGKNAIFAAGVYSKISIFVGLSDYINLLPSFYSVYSLQEIPNDEKFFSPQWGYENDVDAVYKTHKMALDIWKLHEDFIGQVGDGHGLFLPQTKIIIPE